MKNYSEFIENLDQATKFISAEKRIQEIEKNIMKKIDIHPSEILVLPKLIIEEKMKKLENENKLIKVELNKFSPHVQIYGIGAGILSFSLFSILVFMWNGIKLINPILISTLIPTSLIFLLISYLIKRKNH